MKNVWHNHCDITPPVLAGDTGFMKAAQQLITWLEKGNVDKRSANLFYSLIQSSNTHVRRLVMEKQQHEEELNQAQLLFKQRVQGIIVQCEWYSCGLFLFYFFLN